MIESQQDCTKVMLARAPARERQNKVMLGDTSQISMLTHPAVRSPAASNALEDGPGPAAPSSEKGETGVKGTPSS